MHDRLCPDCEPFGWKTEGTSRQVVQSVRAAAALAAMPESPPPVRASVTVESGVKLNARC